MPTVPVCTQAPNDGTLFKGEEEEYLICAREERAKPIGDRRAGRWSPCGAGAEAGRGLWPRGFSVGPELETSESEAGVAARLMTEPWEARKWLEDASPETMRRDGRSSGAGFPANRSREHISRDRRNNRQRVSVPPPKRWTESIRRERFKRSPAGRGQKGRAVFPVDRSWKRRNRRQELRRGRIRDAHNYITIFNILSLEWIYQQLGVPFSDS